MQLSAVYLSDILMLSKLVTSMPCLVVINDANYKLVVNKEVANVVVLRNETKYFFRSEAYPFLLFVNLTAQAISDPGFDAVINFVHAEPYLQLQSTVLQYQTTNTGYIQYLATTHASTPNLTVFNNISEGAPKQVALSGPFGWLGGKNKQKKHILYVYSRQKLMAETITYSPSFAAWANTGADCEEVVLAVNANKNVQFYKVPLSVAAQKRTLNELVTLETITKLLPAQVHIPSGKLINNHQSVVQLLYPTTFRTVQSTRQQMHLQTLIDMYTLPNWFQLQELSAWQHWPMLKKRLDRIERVNKQMPHILITKGIEELYYLYNDLFKLHTPIYTSIAHGSANTDQYFDKEGGVYINNWEHFSQEVPLLYDFFNGIMQECATRSSTVGYFQHAIDTFFMDSIMIGVIKKYALSVKLYYKLFMLQAVSAQLEMYQQFDAKEEKLGFWVAALSQLIADSQYKKTTPPIQTEVA